ncbi:MAG: class II glutamine amidotransferase [Candidatus Pacebacteria bacterium]|nr:class II glutamine amidotransferase [Candidatus Paceibacterota bacterium]
MCRLLAFSFSKKTSNQNKIDILTSFRSLALTGVVPKTITPGHPDGWGVALYQEEQRTPVVYKSTKSADSDRVFIAQAALLLENKITGIAHLRKKTVGELSSENTHPFTVGAFSFVHNGTVTQKDGGPYYTLRDLCRGSTDSERLFQKFLQIKDKEAKDAGGAFVKMIQETKEIYEEYSSLNAMLHTEDKVYIARCYNENHPKSEVLGFEDYYTIYLGKCKDGTIIFSSEKIITTDVEYSLLPNYSVTVLDLASNEISTIPIY